MISVRYHLEVLAPDDDSNYMMQVMVNQPFAAMSVGDTFDTRTNEDAAEYGRLVITGIEHSVWFVNKDLWAHKLKVRTTRAVS